MESLSLDWLLLQSINLTCLLWRLQCGRQSSLGTARSQDCLFQENFFPSPPPFSNTLLLMFVSQMALQGFFCDSSLLASLWQVKHAGARDNRQCEWECAHSGERKRESKKERRSKKYQQKKTTSLWLRFEPTDYVSIAKCSNHETTVPCHSFKRTCCSHN